MPRLNNEDRARALRRLECCRSQDYVARSYNVSRSTITRLVHRVNVTGSLSDRPRPGVPRVTSVRQDNFIRQRQLRDRYVTAGSTALIVNGNHGRTISRKTVRNRLRDRGIRCRRPYRGPVLTPRQPRKRKQWAANNRGRQWLDVVFSDESMFNLSNADSRIRIYRRRQERYADNCVLVHNRFGGVGVMVWAAINHTFKSELVIVNGNLTERQYIDRILRPVVVPMFRQRPGLAFLQDNARPHTARLTRDFLANNYVKALPFPAYYPDYNPIEHMWNVLGRRLRNVSLIMFESWQLHFERSGPV